MVFVEMKTSHFWDILIFHMKIERNFVPNVVVTLLVKYDHHFVLYYIARF